MTYTLAEIKNGTGWPRDARFALVPPGASVRFVTHCAGCDGTGARVEDDGPEPDTYYVTRCEACGIFHSDAAAAEAAADWLGGGADATDASGEERWYVYDVGGAS